MPVRPVLHLPDPVLQQATVAIGELDASVVALLDDLVDTMRASPACVGLAANQIGDGRRACVVDVTGHRKARSCHGLLVLVNPIVVATDGSDLAREGCMSVPDLTGDVARAASVVVRALDRDGQEVTVEADAFEALALLHEVDHLDGKVFLDRVESHAAVFRRKVYR